MKWLHVIIVLTIGSLFVTNLVRSPPLDTSWRMMVARKQQQQQQPPSSWKGLRIAVYMTTHQSASHCEYLEKCWPYATRQLPLLQYSDLIYYYPTRTRIQINNNNTEKKNAKKKKYVVLKPPDKLLQQLHFRNITMIPYINPGKQEGAKQAMIDPFQHGWFDQYDWIVRLNPDVLIRNDSWFLQQMLNTSVDAMLYKWDLGRRKVHSDFNIFRPRAANISALVSSLYTSQDAEQHIGMAFWNLIEANRVAWIPYGKRVHGARVVGNKSFVIHEHTLVQHCPNYFNASGPNY